FHMATPLRSHEPRATDTPGPPATTGLDAAVSGAAAPELALALHEAHLLAQLYRVLEAPLLRGLCAWLAGDLAHSYVQFDEAEVAKEGDVRAQYFLLDCARAIAASERESIERFAAESARRVLARGAEAGEEATLYALLIWQRLKLSPDAPASTIPAGPLGL